MARISWPFTVLPIETTLVRPGVGRPVPMISSWSCPSAVRAEHPLGGVLDPVLGLGGERVLGEVDALLLQLPGLLVR